MKILRLSAFATLALLLTICATEANLMPNVMAGTISGNVHDEFDEPLENADVNLYVYSGSSWSYHEDADTDEFGDFDFGAVADGTYYIRTYPQTDKYISEYYDDAADFDDITELVVTSESDHVLDIALSTKWVYLDDLEIYPEVILHEGGGVAVYGTAVNATGIDLDIYYWVNLDVDFDIDYGGLFYDEYAEWTYLGPERVTLPPGQTPFTFPISLPLEAQSDARYDVNMYIALGHPSVPVFETWVGRIEKLAGR
jgi:hypothetical protein